jgi:hypothetical protein
VRTKHGRDRTLAYRVSGAATRVLSGDGGRKGAWPLEEGGRAEVAENRQS